MLPGPYQDDSVCPRRLVKLRAQYHTGILYIQPPCQPISGHIYHDLVIGCNMEPVILLQHKSDHLSLCSNSYNGSSKSLQWPTCVHACSVMSGSSWLHGLQPTRLLCPWDSPGKNTEKGLPFPPLGDLPDPEIKPKSPVPPALAGGFFTPKSPGNPYSDPQSPGKSTAAFLCPLFSPWLTLLRRMWPHCCAWNTLDLCTGCSLCLEHIPLGYQHNQLS